MERAKALEKGWNGRAHVTRSKDNGRISPVFREAFDQPRDFDDATPGIRPRRVDGYVRSPTGEYTPTAFAERTASRGAEGNAAGFPPAGGRQSPPALSGAGPDGRGRGAAARRGGPRGARGAVPQHSPIRGSPSRSRSRRGRGAPRGKARGRARGSSPAARAAQRRLLRSEQRRREQQRETAEQQRQWLERWDSPAYRAREAEYLRRREQGWDPRHYVVAARGNEQVHHSQKALFRRPFEVQPDGTARRMPPPPEISPLVMVPDAGFAPRPPSRPR